MRTLPWPRLDITPVTGDLLEKPLRRRAVRSNDSSIQRHCRFTLATVGLGWPCHGDVELPKCVIDADGKTRVSCP